MWNEEELCGKYDLCPTWLRIWYQVSHRTAQNFDIVPLWLSHFHQIKCTLLQSRKNLKEMEDLFYDLSNFAAEENEWEGMGLKDVVEKVKPDILIGLSGVGGIFTGFSHI